MRGKRRDFKCSSQSFKYAWGGGGRKVALDERSQDTELFARYFPRVSAQKRFSKGDGE